MNLFDSAYEGIKITKPIRLIELFAGYGSQAMALKRIGANFESWKVVEFDKFAIASYNAIHGTDYQTMDICNIHAEDLDIVDTDKYCYMLTYSFPCTDLSVAGQMKGMSRDSHTRSGLLWEVERILKECDNLPQILFMENVIQVHGKKNLDDFNEWLSFLESLGYKNYWKDLNAKDYGVPQNRNRCFMFSFLGDYNYEFPKPIELTKCVKDILEPEVEEKHYLKSDKAIKLIELLLSDGILTNGITVVDGTINKPKQKDISNCITARYDAGVSNQRSIGLMVVEKNLKCVGELQGTEGHRMFAQSKRVYDPDGISPTIVSGGATHTQKS